MFFQRFAFLLAVAALIVSFLGVRGLLLFHPLLSQIPFLTQDIETRSTVDEAIGTKRSTTVDGAIGTRRSTTVDGAIGGRSTTVDGAIGTRRTTVEVIIPFFIHSSFSSFFL